jgi:hypothetical protein
MLVLGVSVDRLDHVGVVAHSLDDAARQYARLGFRLTPFAQHSGAAAPDRPVEKWGTGNRCAMLRQGYLELIAVVDPALFDNRLSEYLARYEGIHIFALGIDDAHGELARLKAAGFGVTGIHPLERTVPTPHGQGRARFSRIPLPPHEAPEGRIQLIKHETPELLWQPQLLAHDNRAVALAEVVLCAADAAATAARFARLMGVAVEREGDVNRLSLRTGQLLVVGPKTLSAVLPGIGVPTLPYFAGFTVRTEDANRAARKLMQDNQVPHEVFKDKVIVPPAAACGAACVFLA